MSVLDTADAQVLKELVSEIAKYDVNDFLLRISTLNLLPNNQSKCIVFDAVINAVLREKQSGYTSHTIMSTGKFKSIINKAMTLHVARRIDPVEMPFVYRILYRGNAWIFSGINTSVGYNLQHLLNVLFKKENALCKDFLDKSERMTACLLEISTGIAEKLGYDHYVVDHYEQKNVDFSDAVRIKTIADSITISLHDFAKYLDKEEIATLFAQFEANSVSVVEDHNNFDFFYSPFLMVDTDKVIILNPALLSSFLVHYIMKNAQEYGVFEKLVSLYNNEVWYDCRRSLNTLGHHKIREQDLGIQLINSTHYKELLLNVCNDGIVFFQFFCDNGSNYKPKEMFATNIISDARIEKRWAYMKEKLSKGPSDRIYQLVAVQSFGRGVAFDFQEPQCRKHMTLSPFELMCVAISEHSHKNFIPRYIDSKVSCADPLMPRDSDIYDITLYVDNHHSFYFNDDVDMRKTRYFSGYGDSVDFLNAALNKENRQLVDFPNSRYLREVVVNDEKRNIYCNVNVPPFELLNRFSNVDIWTTGPVPTSEQMLNALYTITDVVTYWLAESKAIIEGCLFKSRSIEIRMELEGNIEDYYSETSKRDADAISEFLSFEWIDSTLHMYWSPEAFFNLTATDNSKEKSLLISILNALSNCSMTGINLDNLDSVFSNPLRKKLFTLDYQNNPYLKPIDRDVRIVPNECEDELLNELGYYFIKTKGRKFGEIPNPERKDICNQAVEYLYKKLCNLVQQLDPTGLYELVCYDLEKVMYAMMLMQKRFAFDVACYPDRESQIRDDYNEINKTSIALKFLMEYIAAQPPQGTKILGELDYEYVLSICAAIIDWAHTSDLYMYEIINSKMTILKSGRVGINKSQIDNLVGISQRAATLRLNAHSDPFVEKYAPENIISNTPEELDEAFLDEFGYSFSNYACCIFDLIALGDAMESDVKKADIISICKTVSSDIGVDESIVKNIINDLSLTERADYLTPPPKFTRNDIWPWRLNRRLSFTRRPIVAHGGNLIWGNRQLYHCLLFTLDLIQAGKLSARDKGKLKALMGRITNHSGNGFNDVVADRIRGVEGIIVASKVKKLNGVRIMSDTNQDIGDIDVLIINPRKKKIVACEVKDFSFARTPFEMHQEYLKVFCDNEKELCYLSRHKRRVEWMRNHISDIIEHFKLPNGKWKIDDLLIVNEPIISNSYFHKSQKTLLYTELTNDAILKL